VFNSASRVAEAIAPGLVAQLDGHRISGERAQQAGEVVARGRAVGGSSPGTAPAALRAVRLDASGSMPRRNASMSASLDCARRVEDARLAAATGGQAAGQPLLEHAGVRELLIQLDRELEPRRRARDPGARHLGARLAVERRVHLDRVEVLGVERELVKALRPTPRRRIENTVPRAFAGRVVPARRPDPEVRVSRTAPCRSRRSRAIPLITIGRRIRLGFSIIIAIASFSIAAAAAP